MKGRSGGMEWPGVLTIILSPVTIPIACVAVVEAAKLPFVLIGMLF